MKISDCTTQLLYQTLDLVKLLSVAGIYSVISQGIIEIAAWGKFRDEVDRMLIIEVAIKWNNIGVIHKEINFDFP